jgi:hypothetical protein
MCCQVVVVKASIDPTFSISEVIKEIWRYCDDHRFRNLIHLSRS